MASPSTIPQMSRTASPAEPLSTTRRLLAAGVVAGPLFVVDGVLTGDVTYLNPADIQSVDVLKDAASAAPITAGCSTWTER